ncbi:MAG: hypothetical protein ACRCYU_01660, partial [Nocardioides sp.]
PAGGRWLFKEQPTGASLAEIAASKVMRAAGLRAPEMYLIGISAETSNEGQSGNRVRTADTPQVRYGLIQRLFKSASLFDDPRFETMDFIPCTTPEVMELLKQLAPLWMLDYLLDNFDSHGGNFQVLDSGEIVGIDKGRVATTWFQSRLVQVLDIDNYESPFGHFGAGRNVYELLWNEVVRRPEIDLEQVGAMLMDAAARLQAIDESALTGWIRPMAIARALESNEERNSFDSYSSRWKWFRAARTEAEHEGLVEPNLGIVNLREYEALLDLQRAEPAITRSGVSLGGISAEYLVDRVLHRKRALAEHIAELVESTAVRRFADDRSGLSGRATPGDEMLDGYPPASVDATRRSFEVGSHRAQVFIGGRRDWLFVDHASTSEARGEVVATWLAGRAGLSVPRAYLHQVEDTWGGRPLVRIGAMRRSPVEDVRWREDGLSAWRRERSGSEDMWRFDPSRLEPKDVTEFLRHLVVSWLLDSIEVPPPYFGRDADGNVVRFVFGDVYQDAFASDLTSLLGPGSSA